MQNNPFFLFLTGLIASVTEEQLEAFSKDLKPADPSFTVFGILDLDLQKLWVAIQNLADEAEAERDENKLMKGALAKEYFWASIRAESGWSKSAFSITQGWQIMEKKPQSGICPNCGVDHAAELADIMSTRANSPSGPSFGLPISILFPKHGKPQ